MSVFSVNQNRQFFVITNAAAEDSKQAVKNGVAGSFIVNTGKNENEKSIMIQGVAGPNTIMINKNCVDYATVTKAEDMAVNLKSFKIELDPEINEGNVVASQDYVLRVVFNGFSNEDSYVKDAAVRATVSMTSDPKKFYNALVVSLLKSFNRLYSPLVQISADAAGEKVAVGSKNIDGVLTAVDAEGEVVEFSEGIFLNEMSQVNNWTKDTKPLQTVDFKVIPTTIVVEGDEMVWGKVSDNTADYGQKITNGYKTAELEWFCMGERADQYRTVGYPNNIITSYMVNPTEEYDYLDIQFHYSGPSEDSMKSPKHITIVANQDNKAGLDVIKEELA